MSAQQVDCGCRLVTRFDGKVEVHPCSRAHREVAMMVRRPGSNLIVKQVAS
jgi:hypothetical protein